MTTHGIRETPLLGGTANRGLVMRVGDTVRRPVHRPGGAVHQLLLHLERVGFDGAPRFLGIDEQGREVLSYVDGAAPIQPYPQWAHTDEALVSVARLLRDYHDAVESFDPAPYGWPAGIPRGSGPMLVGHNDPNLDNVVFRDGRAIALIDFDLAGPATRIWDLASAARMWCPLRPDADIHDARRGRSLARFRRIAEAYGLPDGDRDCLVDAVIRSHDWIYALIENGARSGQPGFARYWTGDIPARTRRIRNWLVTADATLRAALA